MFFGLPGDEEEAPLRQALARLGIPWDQLWDAKGPESPLWTSFNVDSTPNFYVFDREGRIAAKRAALGQLEKLLETLTAK